MVCLALALGWTLTRSKRPRSPAPVVDWATNLRPSLARSPVGRPSFVAEGTAVATVMAVGGPVQPLLPGQDWRPGEHLRTVDRPVALATRDDSAVEVEPNSDLQLVRADAERWLRLGSGAVELHVAKLKVGERFVLSTPDAEVEVRGTRFRVAVVPAVDDCGQGTVTRVSVTEGVVVVRSFGRESRVEAGRRWPTDCAEGRVSMAPAQVGDRRQEPKRPGSARANPVGEPASVKVSGSTLGTENDLFGAALKAESAGDKRAAVQLLDVLLARFPGSPLEESAALERARLIGSIHPRP